MSNSISKISRSRTPTVPYNKAVELLKFIVKHFSIDMMSTNNSYITRYEYLSLMSQSMNFSRFHLVAMKHCSSISMTTVLYVGIKQKVQISNLNFIRNFGGGG